MKWIFCFLRNVAPLVAIAILFHSCEKNPSGLPLRTNETADGNIIGTIRDSSGAPGKGVLVKLIPATYNPLYASDSLKIDSIRTDDNGTFSFTLQTNGFFNCIAQNNGLCSFRDSIYGNKSSKRLLQDDTLRSPGSISGTVVLTPRGDNKTVIILVLGTNYYTMTDDSSGNFHIPALAQGNYTLRILTTLNDYGYLDTTVSILSGKNTTVPGVIQLKFEGIPAVGPVTARYDSRTMQVFLSWPACDTSNIASYYVFRNTGVLADPLVILNKNDTVFNDDVIDVNADFWKYSMVSAHYLVAAMGKNSILGKAGASPAIALKSIFTSIDTISLANLGINEISQIAFDNNNNLYILGYDYLSGNTPVIKLNPNGTVIATYVDTTGDIWYLGSDGNANVYLYSMDTYDPEKPFNSERLTRLTSDLKYVSTLPLSPPSVLNSAACNGAIIQNGKIWILYNDGSSTTYTRICDSTLSQVDSFIVPECIISMEQFKDTLYCRCLGKENIVKAYDFNFHELWNWNISDLTKDTSLSLENNHFCIGGSGMSCVYFHRNSQYAGSDYEEVLLLDPDRKLIGRFALTGQILGIDAANRIYWVTMDGFLLIMKL
jgi:hypothetical protein